MSSTPEENRPPDQPRWGQRRPEGSVPHQQPDQGSQQGPGQSPGYGRSAGYGESAGYGQPPGSSQPYGSDPGQGIGPPPSHSQPGGGQFGYGSPQSQLEPGYGEHPGGGQGSRAAPARKPKRPLPLILAMVLMLLAGAAALTLSILSFLDFTSVDPQDVDPFWTQVVEESQAQQGPGAEELTIQDMMLMLGVMALLGGIILAALYTVFAFVGTMTGNVGRILATIFLAGSVFMLLFGPVNLIVTGLSLAAIVALWLPASNTYVRDRKAWKDYSRPASPYAGPGQPGPQNPQGWTPQQPGSYPQGQPQPSPGPYQQGPYPQGPYQQGPYGSTPGSSTPDADDQRAQDNPYGGSTPR